MSLVLVNGTMGAGRHFFIQLAQEITRNNENIEIIDGFELFDNLDFEDKKTLILHNHISFKKSLYHTDIDRFIDHIKSNKCKFVYLYRDPRNMLTSTFRHYKNIRSNFFSGLDDHQALIKFMTLGEYCDWMTLKNFFNDINRFIKFSPCYKIRYENLALSPAVEMSNFFNQIEFDIPFESIEQGCANVPRTGMELDWVRYFSPDVESIFKQHSCNLVSSLGYEKNEAWSYKDYNCIKEPKETLIEYINNCCSLLGIPVCTEELECIYNDLKYLSRLEIRDFLMKESGKNIY